MGETNSSQSMGLEVSVGLTEMQYDKIARLTRALVARVGTGVFTIHEVAIQEFNHCNQGLRKLIVTRIESIKQILIGDGYELVLAREVGGKTYWKVFALGEGYDSVELASEVSVRLKPDRDPAEVTGFKKLYFSSLEWMALAACKDIDTEVFYPITEEDSDVAKAFCGICAVRSSCLEYAISKREIDGVWGGVTEDERRKLLRIRRVNN